MFSCPNVEKIKNKKESCVNMCCPPWLNSLFNCNDNSEVETSSPKESVNKINTDSSNLASVVEKVKLVNFVLLNIDNKEDVVSGITSQQKIKLINRISHYINSKYEWIFGSKLISREFVSLCLGEIFDYQNLDALEKAFNDDQIDVRDCFLRDIFEKHQEKKLNFSQSNSPISRNNCLSLSNNNESELSVDDSEDIPFEEDFKQNFVYFKLEKFINGLSEALKQKLYLKIKEFTKNGYFSNQKFKEALVFSKFDKEDKLALKCFRVLNKYPDLRMSFDFINSKISGMRELKISLFFDVVYIWSKPELAKKYGVSPPNGVLFYGPPGCGKTHIAKILGDSCDAEFIEFSSGKQGSSFHHQTAKAISSIFSKAKTLFETENKKTIIFIDEASSLFPKRDQLDSNASSNWVEEEISEFLKHMEGCARTGTLVLMATNFPEKMDSGILRTGRVDKKIYIGPPDEDTRKVMFREYLKAIEMVSSDINPSKLARITKNYGASDIRAVIEAVSRQAMQDDAYITMKMLEKAISKTRPSLSEEEVEKFKKMGSNL